MGHPHTHRLLPIMAAWSLRRYYTYFLSYRLQYLWARCLLE